MTAALEKERVCRGGRRLSSPSLLGPDEALLLSQSNQPSSRGWAGRWADWTPSGRLGNGRNSPCQSHHVNKSAGREGICWKMNTWLVKSWRGHNLTTFSPPSELGESSASRDREPARMTCKSLHSVLQLFILVTVCFPGFVCFAHRPT